jgi:predicted AAA+ superfamily ATPase
MACAARTGQPLNLSDLTAKSWLSILHASFQVALMPAYHSYLTNRFTRLPKLCCLDAGLYACFAEWWTPKSLEAGAMSGAPFETCAFTEIFKRWWNPASSGSSASFATGQGV